MNDRLIRAARKEKVDFIPVWFMRQAGRYLPEYLNYTKKYSMKEMLKNPGLAAEISLLPFKYFDLDACIIFSDLLSILFGFNIEFKYRKGEGPFIPHKTKEDLKMLNKWIPEKLLFIEKEIKFIKKNIYVPVIGFTSAPFTLFSYLIEGNYKRDFPDTRIFMKRNELSWHRGMKILSKRIQDFLQIQIDAGCDIVKLFDSWIGCLSEEDFKNFVLPYINEIFEKIDKKIIKIYFSINSYHLLNSFNKVRADVIGIDRRIPLKTAFSVLGKTHSIQGNLDPLTLFMKKKEIEKDIRKVYDFVKNKRGYIFNLGHGVLPGTPIENLKLIVDFFKRNPL